MHMVGLVRIVGGGAFDAPRATDGRPYKAIKRYH